MMGTFITNPWRMHMGALAWYFTFETFQHQVLISNPASSGRTANFWRIPNWFAPVPLQILALLPRNHSIKRKMHVQNPEEPEKVISFWRKPEPCWFIEHLFLLPKVSEAVAKLNWPPFPNVFVAKTHHFFLITCHSPFRHLASGWPLQLDGWNRNLMVASSVMFLLGYLGSWYPNEKEEHTMTQYMYVYVCIIYIYIHIYYIILYYIILYYIILYYIILYYIYNMYIYILLLYIIYIYIIIYVYNYICI